MTSTTPAYIALSAAKKAEQFDRVPAAWRIPIEKYERVNNVMDIPLTCGILSEIELRITSDYDAVALLEGLKNRTWSVEQVTIAFCKRAAVAWQLTNCLTEIFFDKAIERAKNLDLEYDSKSGKSLPPLFGLPISLKDSFDVSGYDTSTGLGCYVNDPAKENSALATMLLDLGAILYCKTNLPQSIMTGDSHNNIFGRTLNPHNKLLTAGGSTGGEGALLALRGSVLGVGTDIGGSIRVPASCNGIYGFRCSVGLVPHEGVRSLLVEGMEGTGVRSSVGPMATSLRSCEMLLKTILEAETWKYDGSAISIPWVGLEAKRKLRVGVARDDGVYTPSPPIRRGLEKVVDLIGGDEDIEIVEIDLPDVKPVYQDFISYMTLLGPDYYLGQFAKTGEPPIPSLTACGLLSAPGTTLQGLFLLNSRRAEVAKIYLNLWNDNNLDIILMPPAPHTALPLDKWNRAVYTSLWNYLDYPAIVIPVDQVQDTDFADELSNAKFGKDDEEVYSLYTGTKEYKDAPICVQIVGYRHKDEALLKAAATLDSIINEI